MEREACVCDHGLERSDLCAEIIINHNVGKFFSASEFLLGTSSILSKYMSVLAW